MRIVHHDDIHASVGEHHHPDDIARAFAYAPVVLAELESLGAAQHPSLELFADGSGTLWFGHQHVTAEAYQRACAMVLSHRPADDPSRQRVGITFCCGLVTAARAAEALAPHTVRSTVSDTPVRAAVVMQPRRELWAQVWSAFVERCGLLSRGR